MSKYLVVDRQRVRNNIQQIKRRAGDAIIYGVLKGNAYGLGLIEMADMLRDEGISHFAITEPRDLIILRNSGYIDEEILVMRSTSIPEEIEKLIEYNAIATVGSYDTAIALNGIAEKHQTSIDVHIEIDTGMGRSGFTPEEYDRVLSVFKYMSSLRIAGMYTHYNRAFASGKAVKAQYDKFMRVVEQVKRAGFDPGIIHSANSSALFKYPYTIMDAVRIGSALTGRVSAGGNFGLQKVGHAECQIIEIRRLQKGQTIGYGGDYKCKKSIKIAVLPIGYTDGFCTDKQRDMFRFKDAVFAGLSGLKSWMMRKTTTAVINGKTVPVLGHVGMQHTIINVTDVDCSVGDWVKLEVNPLVAGMMLLKKYV
jgi:alanine racemase